MEKQAEPNPMQDFLNIISSLRDASNMNSEEAERVIQKEIEKYQEQLSIIRAQRDANYWMIGLLEQLRIATCAWSARHIIQDYALRYAKNGDSAKRQRKF